MKKQTDRMPGFLQERNARINLITIWLGLIPLIIGGVGLYNYFSKEEKKYEGTNFKSWIKESCGKEVKFKNCLYLVIEGDTLKTNLNNENLEIYNNSLKEEEKSKIKLIYVENIIKKLTINNHNIVKYRSAFWWGIIFTTIGAIWVGGHIWFFINDPYKKYAEIKDPFGKYKR